MSVKVATVALSAAVAVARLARASTVLAWWVVRIVESTAFALGKCCPDTTLVVDRKSVVLYTQHS